MAENRSEHATHSLERSKKRSPGVPRSPNWCMSEIRVLCEYIRQHSAKILGSATDGPGRNAKKQKHWEKVTRLINERYGQNRVWKQVRKKWVDLTYMAKSYKRNNRVQDSGCATSDGSSDDENLTPVIREVLLALESPKLTYQEFCDRATDNGEVPISEGNQACDRSNEQSNASSVVATGDTSSDSDSEPDYSNFTDVVGQRQSSRQQKKQSLPIRRPASQIQRRLRSRPIQSQIENFSKGSSNQKDFYESHSHSATRNQVNSLRCDEGRQRFGGARPQCSPYPTSKPLQNWKERFSAIDRLVSQNNPNTDKDVGALRSYRNDMLEIEREKVATAKAKLAIMQENLVLKKQELDIHKSLLFYVKNISLNRNTSSFQRRQLRDHHSNVSAEKYPTLGLWDLPLPGQPFQNDMYCYDIDSD